MALFRGQSDGNRLIGDAISTSDLLFLRGGSGGASIVRGGEVLLPNPWGAYGHGQPLRAYFEIYNLDVTKGQSRYRLTYEIHDDPEETPSAWNRLGGAVTSLFGAGRGDPSAAQTFVRAGTEHSARERIAIDIDALKPGRHRLTVAVEDLQSGERTEVDKSFVKAGPAR
jgi:hypothetical protein